MKHRVAFALALLFCFAAVILAEQTPKTMNATVIIYLKGKVRCPVTDRPV